MQLLCSRATLFAPVYTSVTAAPAAGREHPAYLHALSDLRDARAHLERPGGGERKEQERKAVEEIDAAIFEIKKASIEDGKNINDHMPGRLRISIGLAVCTRAVELLDKAHSDVAREEDNRFAEGFRPVRSNISIAPITTPKRQSASVANDC